MKFKVFVDGREGTTGLKIHERLDRRQDVQMLLINPEKRKDPEERAKLMNEADIVFLCLPDAAAREAVTLVNNSTTRIIDASTAHRIAEGWVYGLPELGRSHQEKIARSTRVAVPGCHATGFITALYPLLQADLLPHDYPVTCHSITGYTGGGKKMIEQYESGDVKANNLDSPRFYALGLTHKHIPEMQRITGLKNPPVFTPIVSNFAQGMSVAIPLHTAHLNRKATARQVHEILSSYYKDCRFVKVIPFDSESHLDNGFLPATACNDTNRLEIFVFGHDDQILLLSRLDNLGKGASGAAVQNMNIMLGLDEGTGLE